MLEQVRFTFVIELLSFTHVGDGRMFKADFIPKKDGDDHPQVLSIQRGKDDAPVIEGASIRGALRAHLVDRGLTELATELFGEEDVERTTGSDGKLRLHAGELINANTLEGGNLPYWNRRPCAFILPGVRIHLDTGAAQDKYFYHMEMLPDGCRFQFSGTFLGDLASFEELCGPLFAAMANGFSLGGKSGHGIGRAKLVEDSVHYEALSYNPRNKAFDKTSGTLSVMPAGQDDAEWTITLCCDGPFFIMDPARAEKDKNGPDMLALMRDEDTPVFTGTAFLQELRRRAAWLESIKSVKGGRYDKIVLDDPDRHLKPEEEPEGLTRTQRLFGVPGWGKRVRIVGIDVHWKKRCHKAQGIKLDVFTQAPIDGALIEYEVPADIGVTVRLKLDRTGLAPGDEKFFKQVLDDLRHGVRAPRYGHATGVGFGAFRVEDGACGAGEGR